MILSLGFCIFFWLTVKRLLDPLRKAATLISSYSIGEQSSQPLPIKDHNEVRQMLAGFNRLLNQRDRVEQQVQRLAQINTALSLVNQAIVRIESEQELLQTVCRIAVEFGGMKMAWIGELDPVTQHIQPRASHGEGCEYIDGLFISRRGDVPEGRGPTGTSLRENRVYLCQDFLNDPITLPWHFRGRAFGWRASASFPITRGGNPRYTLTLYSGHTNAFDAESVNLLSELVEDIVFSLNNFDREEQLRLSAMVFDNSTDAIMVTDSSVAIISVNPAFSAITGYSFDEVAGLNPRLLNSGMHNSGFFEEMWRSIKQQGSWQGEIWNRRKNGEVYPEWLSIIMVRDSTGKTSHYVAFFSDISESKAAL